MEKKPELARLWHIKLKENWMLMIIRCWYRSPVRGLKKKRVKWKRAEGVEGPSPGAVFAAELFGGNGRTLMGRKRRADNNPGL